ncbi:MAG: hypothetical protein ACTH3S_05905 [Marinobacter sp.]|uniref:hypothetical protein n=1 Tax=Marinobacter sp. TaxID=50741 RepID=UPI003F9BBF6A
MEPKLLHTPDLKLSPEARWLLLQWSALAGLKNAIAKPRLKLYRQFGMAHRHARSALEELENRGIVLDEKVRQKQGRPISRLHISGDFQRYLGNLEATPRSPHQPEIEALLERGINTTSPRAGHSHNLMTGDERAKNIAPGTYWLLAVLLAHARTPGVVTGLGLRQLTALTGMTRERLRSQLSKLKKLGLINRIVPGASSHQGKSSIRSAYFFNLGHELLMGEESLALTTWVGTGGGRNSYNVISGSLKAAAAKAKLIKHQSVITKKIESAFTSCDSGYPLLKPELRSKGALPFLRALEYYHQNVQSLLPPLTQEQATSLIELQRVGIESSVHAHLLGYAMEFLSTHWDEVTRKQLTPPAPIIPVIKAIEHDCSSLVTAARNGEGITTGIYLSLYQLACHIAKEIQHNLKICDRDTDYAKGYFVIEPAHIGAQTYWHIKVYFRNPAGFGYDAPSNRILMIPDVRLSLPPLLRALPPEITRELN